MTRWSLQLSEDDSVTTETLVRFSLRENLFHLPSPELIIIKFHSSNLDFAKNASIRSRCIADTALLVMPPRVRYPNSL